ncbi:DNA polymerase II subunit B3-1-like [Aristolochia californica]|uniref:DNA polymerase II subunit B3-1-like n=1 Tax=Aristolochia californica TaxID=171875 RepID=UPI0035D592FE
MEEGNIKGTEEESVEVLLPAFPLGRVKKIVKIDKDIRKVNSEALFLVTLSSQLFLQFLAGKSAEAAVKKKRKIIKLEHVRDAVKNHPPTNDFLFDSIPLPSKSSSHPSTAQTESSTMDKPLPAGTRRIDHFFRKSASDAQE